MKHFSVYLLIFFLLPSIHATGQKHIILKNKHIQLTFSKTKDRCTLQELSRLNGLNKVTMQSMEFEILLLNGERLTVNEYQLTDMTKLNEHDIQILRLVYEQNSVSAAPKKLSVLYELGKESYYRKQILIESDSSGFIDRLQTMRFTTALRVSGGGFGQPLFIDNWFLGMDYPGFYSWHSNNFTSPEFNLRNPYDIDLEGRDQEFAARKGLTTIYHFPGYADQDDDGTYKIKSKKVVMGICENPSLGPETALLNYIEKTRLKPRSFLHFNNWYSHSAKKITIEDFVINTYLPVKNHLSKYGVQLDAMVPDHGWQDSKFEQEPFRIYTPKIDANHEDLISISDALMKEGTALGIWLAIDGRNTHVEKGVEAAGYRSAISESFDKTKYKWTANKPFFDILDPKYQEDLKESIKYLMRDAHVVYFKHDFNHLFTSHYITERHAREKCLDATLEILKYERELNPDVFLNYTNGSWFSPFWLQYVHTLWMMSGDSGGNGDYPQLSLREGATTYRDKYFFDNFRLERTDRPVIPISNFMTHGILYSEKKPFTNFNDIIDDWSNYVVMYYGRGTTLKELYITPDLLTTREWEVLGRASKWAVVNQENLLNTVFIGGDPSVGSVYGYISWNNDKAVLTVRNPQRIQQDLQIPFDESVFFTGAHHINYRARCIYPFVEEMPWHLESGQVFNISVPGDCVQVFEFEKGQPLSTQLIAARPLPEPEVSYFDNGFSIDIEIPDEDYRRCELLFECYPPQPLQLSIDNKTTGADRNNTGKSWSLSSLDLQSYKGSAIRIKGILPGNESQKFTDNEKIKVYLLADQRVTEKAVNEDQMIPLNIMQGYRRSTKLILEIHRN